MMLENARKQYEELFEKPVPNNKKNDVNWIINQVDTKLGGTITETPKKKKIPEDIEKLGEELAKQPNGHYYSGDWEFVVLAGRVEINKNTNV